jgi:hypothetical protein
MLETCYILFDDYMIWKLGVIVFLFNKEHSTLHFLHLHRILKLKSLFSAT